MLELTVNTGSKSKNSMKAIKLFMYNTDSYSKVACQKKKSLYIIVSPEKTNFIK